MNEEDIRKGIEILQDAVKDNRVHSKQFIIGENALIVTLNALHRAIDLEKELQQAKEKNKKLEEELNKFRKGEIFSANQAKFMEKQNKVLQKVIDLMAIDNTLLCTDYEFGCFYEKNAECMKGPVRNCKKCIRDYYFKKARGEENEK